MCNYCHLYTAIGKPCEVCQQTPVGKPKQASKLSTQASKPKSRLEADFAAHYALLGADLPALKQEYIFHPTRRWRFDFAIVSLKIAIEVEGGVYSNGRHTRGKGFIEDCYKYNAAAVLGWRVLRYTSEHLKNPFAVIAEIRQLVDYLDKLDLAA